MEKFYPEVYHPEGTENDSVDNPENVVEKRETGENVIMHIYLIRHGKRAPNQIGPEAELTEEGIQECIKLGNKIGTSPVIGGECSCYGKSEDCLRTLHTAQAISFGSRAEDKRPIEKREELASHTSEEFRNKIRAHVRKLFKDKYPELSEEEINNMDLLSTVEGIDFYLNCRDEDLDDKTYSPLETAASVALRINAAIEQTAEMESEKTMDYLLATHDYIIAAFLQQVLLRETKNGQTKKGFDSLAELGDKSIEFLENLEIIAKTDSEGNLIINTDSEGNKTIDAAFRGQKCGINMGRLKELVEIGNHLKEAERIYSK